MDDAYKEAFRGAFLQSVLPIGLSVASIVIGIVYKDEYCENRLALWNIVYGAAGLFLVVIGFGLLFALMKGMLGVVNTVSKFVYLVSLFCFAWFIVGNVWTYGMSFSNNQCSDTLFKYTFSIITASYGIGVLSCCFRICKVIRATRSLQ